MHCASACNRPIIKYVYYKIVWVPISYFACCIRFRYYYYYCQDEIGNELGRLFNCIVAICICVCVFVCLCVPVCHLHTHRTAITTNVWCNLCRQAPRRTPTCTCIRLELHCGLWMWLCECVSASVENIVCTTKWTIYGFRYAWICM